MHRLAPLVLLFAMAACRQAEPPPATAADPPVPIVKSHAAGVAAAQVIGPAEAAASRLALDAEGLRLLNAVSGASRLIPFGTTRTDALRAIESAQRTPARATGVNDACRAAYVAWKNGLTVWFGGERFVGWSVQAGEAGPGTAAGLKVGSSRGELDGAYAAKIGKSTLGTQFRAGALAGLLDSDRPDARVTELWAGVTCIAR
jgi:hypothetical protein